MRKVTGLFMDDYDRLVVETNDGKLYRLESDYDDPNYKMRQIRWGEDKKVGKEISELRGEPQEDEEE